MWEWYKAIAELSLPFAELKVRHAIPSSRSHLHTSGWRVRGLAWWFLRQLWTCPISVFCCLSSPFSKDRVRVVEASFFAAGASCFFQQLQNGGKTPLLSKDSRELLLGHVCLRRCVLCCTFLLKAFTLMCTDPIVWAACGLRAFTCLNPFILLTVCM